MDRPSEGITKPALVSVLTPSYNYGHFLDDAILSVRAQGGAAVEHVIQDGASTDDSGAIAQRHPDVRWVSEPDRGQSDALNRALRRAHGSYISWLNADEFYLPFALERMVATAEARGADVVYADPVFVDEVGRFERLVPQHPFSRFFLKQYGCYIASCTVLFRRSILEEDPWDERFRLAMDWDLYLRLAEKGARFAYLGSPVAAFRLHPEQVIAQPTQTHADEFVELSRRHGVGSDFVRKLGRWPHDVYKLVSGSYPRQLRARRLDGTDMRWFRSNVGTEGVSRLFSYACREEELSRRVEGSPGAGDRTATSDDERG